MALRDLLLGRRRRTEGEATSASAGRVGTTVAPELAEVISGPQEAKAAPEAAVERAKPAVSRRKVVASRVTTSVIDGTMAAGERCYAALDRLGLVHDAAEVRLTASDGMAGFVVAARQIVFARFAMQDGFEETFDFRPEPLSIDRAVRFLRVFVAFCGRPMDMEVEESPVAGVFPAEVGLAVGDVTFDEEVFRDHLQQRAAERVHPEPEEAPREASAEPESTPEPVQAAKAVPAPDPEIAAGDEGDGTVVPLSRARANIAKRKERQSTEAEAKGTVEEEAGAAVPSDDTAPQPRPVAATDLPFAFLAACRAQAEDVLRHTRAGAEALPSGRATDGQSDDLNAPSLAAWRSRLGSALGPKLVAVFVPVEANAKITLLAMDDESVTAFRAHRQALGGLCNTAVKMLSEKG